jgi:hypothetical protein
MRVHVELSGLDGESSVLKEVFNMDKNEKFPEVASEKFN